MAARLGRVIYWICSGIATIVGLGALLLAFFNWAPVMIHPAIPPVSEVDKAEIRLLSRDGSGSSFSSKFPSGFEMVQISTYPTTAEVGALLEGKELLDRRSALRSFIEGATKYRNFQRRMLFEYVPLCLLGGLGLFGIGRAARYVLANE